MLAMSAGAAAATARMPPGPPLPRWLQTIGFILWGPRFVDLCRRRYGGAITFATLFDSRFVIVLEPALVKELFQGSNDALHAGEANALLGPILGHRSVLLLDGDEHLRHRRLLLPGFHGRQLQSLGEVVLHATDAEIDSWPLGRPFALLPSMQSLTLQVILRAVFGYEPGEEATELGTRLRDYIAPLATPRSVRAIVTVVRNRRAGRHPLESITERRDRVDQLLFAEISRRRGLRDDELEGRDDVFSALLLARDEDGGRLTDEEVRDELLTLLLAGHETTATGLAWAFDLLLHSPAVLQRALALEDVYLDAVAKEALRVRPVIPGVGRVVSGAPYALGDWLIPPGSRSTRRSGGSTAALTSTPTRLHSAPSGSSPTIRRTHTRGSRSAAAPVAASARASR